MKKIMMRRRKVIEPLGECRSVFEIEYEIAKRMSLDGAYPWTNTEGWINHRLKASGITLDELKERSVIYTTPPIEYRKYLTNGLNTPSGKVEKLVPFQICLPFLSISARLLPLVLQDLLFLGKLVELQTLYSVNQFAVGNMS